MQVLSYIPGCLISRYFIMVLGSSGVHMVPGTIMDHFSRTVNAMPKLPGDLFVRSYNPFSTSMVPMLRYLCLWQPVF